jgi:para-nitrobenzyl esterase
MIIGSNHDEQRIFLFLGIGGKLPVSDTGYTEQVHTLFGANAERVLAEYPLKANPNASIALSTVLDGYVGRSCRSVAMVDEFSKTASVWHFEFNDQTAPPQFPHPDYFPIAAAHAHELQYFFAFDSTAQLAGPQVTLSKQMQAYWTAFATTGDPGSAGGPTWPRWVAANHQTVSLQTGGNTIRTNVADDHKCAFWVALGFGLP